jgi:transposase
MFLRTVKASGGKGTTHEYVRLVESYRENGKTKQRVVMSLGRKELLTAHLGPLVRLLSGKAPAELLDGTISAVGAWDWGPVLAVRTMWEWLGLATILERHGGRSVVDRMMLSERALVLVTNRLCAPSSEHGLARWLERDFVCDRRGRRWTPEWRTDEERKASRLPRVRVGLRQLKQWYRTLDQLRARKQEVERALYFQLRDLFSLEVDFVFYDLTSTYFEGEGPPGLAAYGHSRDGKPRNRQVQVGVVMVNGWPIAHHVFRGNLHDDQTVVGVLEDLEQRFGLKRVVFVGDRGMVSKRNLAFIKERREDGEGLGYVIGLQRRRRPEIQKYLARATEAWEQCPVGICSQEKKHPPKTLVQEVASDEPGVRIFVVHSDERLAYESAMRERAMDRTRLALAKLQGRVDSGKLRAPEKIGAAAARILARNHGNRYYTWELTDGAFRFLESANLTREKAYEGKYLIQTEEKDLTPVQAVQAYKELAEVERGFRDIKDVIQMRPIYHQTDNRVEAHIFVAALALLIQRAIEKRLQAAGLDLSATEALQALRTVKVVDFDTGDGHVKRTATRGSPRAMRILAALGIDELTPPIPPEDATTLV